MNTVKRVGIAAALVAGVMLSTNPASATGVHPPIPPKIIGGGGSSAGAGIVGGIILCAGGIWLAAFKHRKERELTFAEGPGSCGLRGLMTPAGQTAPKTNNVVLRVRG